MAGGHSHSHGHSHRAGEDKLPVAALPRTVLIAFLVAVLVAVIVGLVLLLPDGAKVDRLRASVPFAAAGSTYPQAVVTEVEAACPPGTGGDTTPDGTPCGSIKAKVAEGAGSGTTVTVSVPPEVSEAGLSPGSRLELLRTPAAGGNAAQFSYFGIARSGSLWLLLGLFVLVVLAVARLRGLLALIGLAVSGAVFFYFILPALLTGEDPVLIGVVGSAAILYVVLYLTHGFSVRTSVALAGTLAGLGVTVGVGSWAVHGAHLTGVVDEGGSVLTTFVSGVSFQGLMTCAIIIAGLGVLNDVTITQASSVWELRAASPTMSRARLFASGMRIGSDHIASTIYTIVFAYAGSALTVLLVIQLYDRPLLGLIGTEEIAEEIVRSLVSSIGLVLAVPLTTAIATLVVPAAREPVAGLS